MPMNNIYFQCDAQRTVLKHLTNLPELKDLPAERSAQAGSWSDEQKLATIENVYKELSDPVHPVSIAMTKMQDIPEIRIIEGRTK